MQAGGITDDLGVFAEALWQLNTLLYLLDAFMPAVLVCNPKSGKAILAARGYMGTFHEEEEPGDIDQAAESQQQYLVTRFAYQRHASLTSIH